MPNILKQEVVYDQKVIKSTFFIEHTNYIVYFWLSVKNNHAISFRFTENSNLAGSKKAGREKFWKHQSPKSGQKSSIYVFLVTFVAAVRSQQNRMYECNFESSFILNFLVRKDFIVQTFRKLREKKLGHIASGHVISAAME